MITVAVLLGAYFLGGIPSALWLGLTFAGKDIRQHGSGNLGATNAYRVLGKGLGITVLLLDAAKGVAAVMIAMSFASRSPIGENLPLAAGFLAIAGHIWTPFAGFRGGKGVATSAGVFAVQAPLPMLAALIAFAFVLAVKRIVSPASMVAACVFTATAGLGFLGIGPPISTNLFASILLVSGLILFKHRGNFQRLRRGEEKPLW